MIGYKLCRRMGDGYAPLFHNRWERWPVNEWVKAHDTGPKAGFAYRPYFHICTEPHAPQISRNDKRRVWVKVEFEPFETIQRPASQGGLWHLARHMRVLRELTAREVENECLATV